MEWAAGGRFEVVVHGESVPSFAVHGYGAGCRGDLVASVLPAPGNPGQILGEKSSRSHGFCIPWLAVGSADKPIAKLGTQYVVYRTLAVGCGSSRSETSVGAQVPCIESPIFPSSLASARAFVRSARRLRLPRVDEERK